MKYRLRNGILLTPNGTEELDLLINGKRIEVRSASLSAESRVGMIDVVPCLRCASVACR